MSVANTVIAAATVRFLVVSMLVAAPAIAAESLEFQKSKANLHVAVQPRQDYHRVHFVVKANGLSGQQCIARLTCTTDNRLLEDNRVIIQPTTDSQTCAVYLRTPKLLSQTATYVLQVAPTDGNGPDLGRKSALIYMWTVHRDASGNSSLTWPKPGETFDVVIPVSRKINDGGEVGFKIVWETKVKPVTVPEGFLFGVDTTNTEDVFEPVLLLNE